MRAVMINEFGNRDTVAVEEIDDPVPGPGEVLVDVKVAGVNFTDLLSLDGKYQNLPPVPFTPGKDASGVVAAVGDGVTLVSPGERVIAHVNDSALAERVIADERLCFRLPDDMDFETAAAIGLPYETAYVALALRGGLKAGERVLINGASGGVGLAAVEIAKALGAQVLAGLTTPSKGEAVMKCGADAIIDLSGENLRDVVRDQVMAATDGAGVDLVFDLVGGAPFEASMRAIAWSGRAVVSGFTTGTIPSVKTNYLLLKNIAVVGMAISSYFDRRAPEIAVAQAAIFELWKNGKIHPHIMARFPLDDFRDAIALIEDRKIVGKAVLLMEDR
jgi:NADPH2:quinone reductase